jgi:membrane fusion protein (multidrug efflux system)
MNVRPSDLPQAGGTSSPRNAPAVAAAQVTTPQLVPASAAPVRKRSKARLILLLALLAALGGGGSYGRHWWTVGRFLETTEDAYLQADKVTVAPRIAGHVAEVLVGDNERVKPGDVIARLDDREYRIALKQEEADVEKSRAQVLGTAAAIMQQQAQVESAKAEVENTDAALDFAGKEYTRYQNLLQTGSGTAQRQQQADADLRQKRAAHNKAVASLDAARKQVESLKALEGSAKASLDGAQAKVEQAQLNLTYTTITAPIEGIVGDRSLRVGQFVSAGTGLLTVVPMGRDIYLLANFKETQTGQMVEGQRVSFTVDALGDHEFEGRVESFSPGTGAQFALLPPENATGNFTKVVQRVPVRVALNASDPMLGRLRAGLSVEATVHTRDAIEPVTPRSNRPAHALVSEALPR